MVDVADPQYAGLQAWWKMDEGSGLIAADSMAGAADGTLASPVWTTGRDLGGLAFDGNDRITCGNSSSLGGSTPFTVTAWVKVNAGNNTEGIIVQQRAANGFNGQYQLKVLSTGRLGFYVYGNSAEQFNFAATTAINDGQWHHVAARSRRPGQRHDPSRRRRRWVGHRHHGPLAQRIDRRRHRLRHPRQREVLPRSDR